MIRFSSVRSLSSLAKKALGLGLLVVVASSTSFADGGTFPTPEIDPGSMAGAMTLLTGGVLMLTDKVRARKA